MEFFEKLQKIRKEHNITQEGLADKLGVSRQAVSKWESGSAYPDTEKLIQISRLFNISLDELINDNEIQHDNTKKKFNFKETFNIVYGFISKTFSMFWSMKFWEKIKFLIEMALVILAIIGAGALTNGILVHIVRRIFMFLPYKAVDVICYIVDTLLYLAWVILGAVLFIKILKSRYLNYYVVINDDSVSERVVEEPIRELKEKKEYKVVIRDPEDSSLNIFKKIGKIFILILKFIGICLLMPIASTFLVFIIILVISLTFSLSGLFFNGISIAIFGCVLFSYLFIEFILRLVFDRKFMFTKMFIIFIASISLIGIGIGLSFSALNKFEFYEDNGLEAKISTIDIDMKDNLLLDFIDEDKRIVIDDKLDNIKLDIKTNASYEIDTHLYLINYGTGEFNKLAINNISDTDTGEWTEIKDILNDLKHRRIKKYGGYGSAYSIEKIYVSNNNLTKLKENYKKAYN